MIATKTVCVETRAVADATEVIVTLGTQVAKWAASATPAKAASTRPRVLIAPSSARLRTTALATVKPAPIALRQKAMASAGAAVAAMSGPDIETPITAMTRTPASRGGGKSNDSGCDRVPALVTALIVPAVSRCADPFIGPRPTNLYRRVPSRSSAVTTAPRVFIARLSGIGVFDPNGDLLGRLRDAVTTLRIDRQPPRVLGLVIELPGRLRIFVPMGRVTRIEPDAIVLSSGTVNMKRFEPRSNEVLVLAGLLDRTVTVREDQQRVSIVDVAMEQNRARDWVLIKLAVRAGAGRLTRRRGQLFQVAWDEVDGLTISESESADQGTDTMLSMFEGMRAADVATALQDMPDKRRHEVAAALDDERLADVLQELPEDEQVDLHHVTGRRTRRRHPRGDGRRRRRRPAG